MKILIWDIEALLECFFVGIYIPEEDKRYEFGVNQWENTLDGFIKFTETHKDYYWTGYNNLKYDGQIIEWVLRNYQNWHDLTGLEICALISQESNDNIDNSNYGLFSRYREYDLTLKQLDLPLIWHLLREGKNVQRVSLKAIQYATNWYNVEEMPIHHLKKDLTKEEIQLIKDYCFNDIMSSYELYLYTIGETDNPLYKGKNKIKDRLIIQEETGLNCLNFDDVKIGAMWNQLDYCKLTGKNEKELKPKKVSNFFGKKYKVFFPNTVKFQTKELQQFVKELGETFIKNEEQQFKYRFNKDLTVTVMRGGIHSNEKPRYIKPTENQLYLQCDIGSQYPNAIRKYKIYPSHLGIEWNNMLVSKIERRLKYKKLAKDTKDPKYESLQEMGKLSLNGGAYGRLNTQGDWQQDPCAMLKVTMGCQLEILMIIEALILKDYNIVSANTDGWDALIDKSREKEFKEIISYYEELIGNKELGNVEYTEFEWIAQTSVSGYIAKRKIADNKGDFIKKKGAEFKTDFELREKKSKVIIAKALEQYFTNNISIDETIRNHKNIYDFCSRVKSSKDFHYEGVSKKGTNVYRKLIRYYVSESGESLFKIKNPECTTNAPDVSIVEKKEEGKGYSCVVCNFLPKTTKVEDCNINYDFYIGKCQEIITKIQLEGRKAVKKQPINQLGFQF